MVHNKLSLTDDNVALAQVKKKSQYKRGSFLCTVCGLTCTTHYSLKDHMRTHTGEKPYACKVCGTTKPCRLHNKTAKDLSASWMKCPTCLNMFAPKELSVHIEEDHSALSQIKYIACPICSCEMTKPKLVEHINTEHNLPPALIYSICNTVVEIETCRKCSKVFTCKYDLRGHLENVHNYSTCVPCSTCEQLVQKESLKQHFARHDDITCPLCDVVATKANLSIHVNSEHTSLELDEKIAIFEPMLKVCRLCSKVFKDLKGLSAHTRSVHKPKNQRSFVCLICSKEICGKDKIRYHIQRHDQHDRIHQQRVPCPLCTSSFINKYNLKQHMRIHTGEKPFSCNICGKCFTQNNVLKTHMVRHAEARPPPKFVCPHCGKTSLRSGDHRLHLLVHSDDKPYSCSICDARFKSNAPLLRHKRTHANIRPYACSVCAKAFSRGNHLTVHMRSHTGERPYPCLICGKAFMQNCVLKSHVKAAHSVPDAE